MNSKISGSIDPLSLALCHYDFLTLEEKRKIQKKLDNPHDLALISIEELSVLTGRVFSAKSKIPDTIELLIDRDMHLMKSYSIGVLFYEDDEYPSLLKEIFDPPFALFYRGNMQVLNNLCVSVVGTRRPTGRGMKSSFDLASELCVRDITVVSGLAHGIDSFAHKGAVDSVRQNKYGSTVAVLASGPDSVYPSENRKLAASIMQCGGCLVSEYPPLCPPLKWHFPQRNRIISGLSKATVVIEAPAGSGALITADFALEQDRELLFHEAALDYTYTKSLVNPKKMSPSRYVAEGAGVIKTAQDVIDRMMDPCTDGSVSAGLHFSQLKLDLQ